MKAFISYSTRDRQHGATVKSVFEGIGIESFLAHDDLRVSEQWKNRILEELRACRIFVPLLSKSFKTSQWCDQETGFIVRRRGVLIVPLSLDGTMPYGFISHLQGKQIRDGEGKRALILDALARKWPGEIIDRLIQTMERVHEFREAERTLEPLVPLFSRFTVNQAKEFATLAVNNYRIWNANLCREQYLPRFLKANKGRISKLMYRALKHQTQYGTKYEQTSA